MANWQQIEQLADITADLPRFSDALQRFAARLGLEIGGSTPTISPCAVIRTPPRSAGARSGTVRHSAVGEYDQRPAYLPVKLAEPVCVAHWRFHIVELPWPGEKRYPHEGWEHIEIVLPGDPATLNARALALLADDGLSQPGIVVKTSSPKGEHERLPNPTLAVTDGSVTVKFHPWSIEQIVASEQADT
jgi:predicted metalloenzyme YecM